PFQKAVDLLDAVGGCVFGDDRLAAGRKLVDDRDIEVAVQREREGAGDGSRGHHQYVGMPTLLQQPQALQHAKAVLLVDNGQAEAPEFDIFLQQGMRAHRNVRQAFRHELLQLDLLAGAGRARQQHDDIAQLGENLFEIETVLGRQDFGGREHGDLISIFDGDHGRLRRHDRFAAAHVALQKPVHGARLFHIVRDFPDDPLLRLGGLERQHGFYALADAVVDLERNARQRPSLGALERDAAFQPEELFENQPELGGSSEAVEQAQVGVGRRKMGLADGGPAVGQLEHFAQMDRQVVLLGREFFQDAVHEHAHRTGVDLGDSLVDWNDTAHVQRSVGAIVVASQELHLGMEHGQLTGVTVVLDFAVESHPDAFRKDL